MSTVNNKSESKTDNQNVTENIEGKDINNNDNKVNCVNNNIHQSSSKPVINNNGTSKGSTNCQQSTSKDKGKRFRLPFFNKKSNKSGKPMDETINEEGQFVSGRRRTSSVSEKDMEAVRKNSKALAIRRGPHGIEPESQSAPVFN